MTAAGVRPKKEGTANDFALRLSETGTLGDIAAILRGRLAADVTVP